jgi:hypothetical protein
MNYPKGAALNAKHKPIGIDYTTGPGFRETRAKAGHLADG